MEHPERFRSLERDFEQRLLLALGHAARICPLLWEGLETDRPRGVILNMDTAFDFLKDDAWVLEDAGFKVVVPAWWTPKGRQRARVRIRSSTSKSVGKQDAGKGWFSLPSLVQYEYGLSLKAGGVGLTLTKANHMFHFDRWWNPAVENQATDRAFRIGQEKKVFAHKLVALGTLEERIDRMLEDKQRLADSIVGQDESWLTELDNDAFRQLIRLNRDAVMEA